MVTLTSAENALKTLYLGVVAEQLNPNASVENNNTVYYICREGNIYRFEDRKNDVVAYCEFYIPYKSGGVMIWSKKLCVFSRGIN